MIFHRCTSVAKLERRSIETSENKALSLYQCNFKRIDIMEMLRPLYLGYFSHHPLRIHG